MACCQLFREIITIGNFFQNVDSDKILKLLEELYLEGFRLDLVSPDRKERFSAVTKYMGTREL